MVVAPAGSDQTKSPKGARNKDKSEALPETPAAGKKKQNKRKDEDPSLITTPETAHDERPKKRKKVEQKEPDINDAAGDVNVELDAARPKRPKRPKDKAARVLAKATTEEPPSLLDKVHIADIPIPYTNPLTDTSLPELSRRGLAYAYQYAQHVSLPSDAARAAQQPWKFNKGRQNWIIRNVTEPTVIPDSYLALAMVYIESIKGGARDVLKKTCKTTKKKAKAATEVQADDQPQTADSEANPVLKKVEFAPAEPLVGEEKRKRAKKILKVLKGKARPGDV